MMAPHRDAARLPWMPARRAVQGGGGMCRAGAGGLERNVLPTPCRSRAVYRSVRVSCVRSPQLPSLELVAVEFGVEHGVPDVLVAEPMLDRARVLGLIDQAVAAGMPQLVRVYRRREAGIGRGALQHASKPSRRHRPAAFGHKDELADCTRSL